ncbi:MAG: sugar porter family MFS transporter [Solirubrobacteraceae bacterium]
MSSNRRIYFFGALGGALFGYDTGVISGAILFITKAFHVTPFTEGAIVSGLLLGALVGAALAGPLSDRWGRRRLIIIAGVVFTVGALGSALAPGVGVLIVARFVLGLAVGCSSLAVPIYLSEIAPTKIRGAISSLNQLMVVVGILVASIVNAALASSGAWRVMLGAAIVPSLALLVGMAFMPETPRFLVHTGEEDQARDVLESVRPDEPAEREIGAIRDVEEQVSDADIRELGAKWVRPALLVAIGLAVFQQFIGINTIVYYAPTTLTKVGYGNQGAIYANIIIGVLMVAATVVAVRVIDRTGRKPLLLWGVVGMGTSLAVLGIGSAILATPKHPGDPAAILTLACLAAYIVAFAVSWGPVVWVMLPEVLPLSVRGAAMGVAVSLQWGANFVVSVTFPSLLSSLGPGPVFLGYAVICGIACAFVAKFVTETKGRSLEQIESDLQETTGVDGGQTESRPANAASAGSPRGHVAG